MVIVNLEENQQYIGEVVDILYSEWGANKRSPHGGAYRFWESWVKSSLSKQDIPQTYIAIEDCKLIGTYSLWRCDLQSRQDLFPWFGGLYVKPNYRGKNIGKELQLHAIRVLKSIGYSEAYLFSDSKGYYEKMGWTHIGMAPDIDGEMVHLYMIYF